MGPWTHTHFCATIFGSVQLTRGHMGVLRKIGKRCKRQWSIPKCALASLQVPSWYVCSSSYATHPPPTMLRKLGALAKLLSRSDAFTKCLCETRAEM